MQVQSRKEAPHQVGECSLCAIDPQVNSLELGSIAIECTHTIVATKCSTLNQPHHMRCRRIVQYASTKQKRSSPSSRRAFIVCNRATGKLSRAQIQCTQMHTYHFSNKMLDPQSTASYAMQENSTICKYKAEKKLPIK